MPRNIPENDDDFIRMQQEAIRRVREMQERARRTLEDAGMNIASPYPEAPVDNSEQNPPPVQNGSGPADTARRPENTRTPDPPVSSAPPPRQEPGSQGRPPGMQIFNLNLDTEQILLMVLVYMLYRDGADNYLVLALVYTLLL